MAQNPWNAVLALGHANGCVTHWTPNMATPVVKMLCHRVSRGCPVTMAACNDGCGALCTVPLLHDATLLGCHGRDMAYNHASGSLISLELP